MFSQFACCQLPNYTENANFQIRISQNAKARYMHLCLSTLECSDLLTKWYKDLAYSQIHQALRYILTKSSRSHDSPQRLADVSSVSQLLPRRDEELVTHAKRCCTGDCDQT